MPHLREAWREWRPDLVVYDATDGGAAVVADELGIPRIAFGILDWAPLLGVLPRLARRAIEPVDAVPPPWEQVDEALEASPDTVPLTYIDSFPLRWRTRRRPVPQEVLELRPVPFSLEGSEAIPQERLRSDRPLVYVTLGTVANRRVDALRAAVLGAASLDVDVLVAAGPDAELGALTDLPSNVTVRGWVDQPAVLERAAVAIHHGGVGTLCACAAAGVPQLLLPQLADQPHNAERVAEIGPGRVLRRDEVTADAVRAMTAELLADGPHSAQCAALAGEIAAMPAPGEVAADLLARIGR
jgi:UDP:flavonoid glycosyltransferase YjiC (YdhE family)